MLTAVSYTHLDVYKRQDLYAFTHILHSIFSFLHLNYKT